MAERICSIEDCDRPATQRGWCGKHYNRWRATGDPLVVRKAGRPANPNPCVVEGCAKPPKGLGMCPAHYRRHRLGLPIDAPVRSREPGRNCEVEGCDRPYLANDLCSMHWQRQYRRGEVGSAERQIAAAGTGYINPDGYRVFRRDGTTVQEHRLVMEQHLGRPLAKNEQVHHRDGNRSNNDLANLELWYKQQPSGQRIADLIAFIAEYHEDAMRAELKHRRRDQRSGQLRLLP